MNFNGHECEVNAKVDIAELQEISGKKDQRIVGYTTTYPRTIYVARDHNDRASTFLHEMIHQVVFTNPELKKKLRSYNDDEEKYVIMLEEGLYNAYKSYGHQLPDPYLLEQNLTF
jgi:hypothetical protein